MDQLKLSTPYYVMHEDLLRRNLNTIHSVASEAGVEIILAFKAFALWKTFGIFREYISATTASSPFEAQLAREEFGNLAHTYSPAYEHSTFHTIMECSSHVTFNSLKQYAEFSPCLAQWNADKTHHSISVGIRINPEHSEIATDIYNPCAPGSRFGVTADKLPYPLPGDIDGLHCHCHCESDSYALERTLRTVEAKFGKWLDHIKWLNLGGGHLMTRQGYDTNHLVKTLRGLKQRHPHLGIILEPGSAFAWETGELVATVIDIVENNGIKTAIVNASFTCHMPDCLEMPYQPKILGAESLGSALSGNSPKAPHTYRIGGNSCLSGDFMGYWRFEQELKTGDTITFLDMIHYTTVKTTMFNGIQHPAIVFEHSDGCKEILRKYVYEDYKRLMD